MFCVKCGRPLNEEDVFCSVCGNKVEKATKKVKTSNNKITKVVVACVIGIFICVGLFFSLFFMSDNKGKKNAMVTLTNGKYRLWQEYDKKENVYLESAYDGLLYDRMVFFSEDGKNVYYLANSGKFEGNLYRAEIKKVNDNSSENSEFVTLIDKNVDNEWIRCIDNKLFYLKDYKLYCYDGEKTQLIDSDVEYCVTIENDGVAYLREDENLYYVNTNDLENKKLCATNVDEWIDERNNYSFSKNEIYYYSDMEDEYQLCVTGIDFDGKGKVICKKVSEAFLINETLFYENEEDESICIYRDGRSYKLVDEMCGMKIVGENCIELATDEFVYYYDDNGDLMGYYDRNEMDIYGVIVKDNNMMVNTEDGKIYRTKMNQGLIKMKDSELVEESGLLLGYDEFGIQYMSLTDKQSEIGDLYCIDASGKKTLLAENLYTHRMYFSDLFSGTDGTFAICSLESEEEGKLVISNKKETSKYIADDVSCYKFCEDGTLLYISQGDLYKYDGEKVELLDEKVEYIWLQNEMENGFLKNLCTDWE